MPGHHEKPHPTRKLAEGSYGCVYAPPVPCKKERRTSSSHTIGKVLRQKDAIIELRISTVLRSIPDWKHYFLLQEKAKCDSSNFAHARATLSKECEIIGRASDSDLVQLLSSYGGQILFHTPITPQFNFIGSLRHMLEACVRLEEQGVCHFDLHDGNVALDSKNTLRLLDFGSAFLGDTADEATVRAHAYPFTPEYAPQPPELSVQNGVANGLSYQEAIRRTIDAKEVFHQRQSVLGIPMKEATAALTAFWTHSSSVTAGDWARVYQTHWRTWDPWAVGVMFMGILRKGHLNPTPAVKAVLTGLLKASPTSRMTAAEALEILET